MDFSARATTKDAARSRRRRSCTPPRSSSTLPPWARIYCRTPAVRIARLTTVASFSGVSR